MNTQNAQNAILDQLRAIPHGTKVRFLLRDPDGNVFPHVSAIEHDRDDEDYPGGFDSSDASVALATEVPDSLWEYNGWWATYGKGNRYMCAIVGIEPLAPELPDLETLQKWVADGTTVRIDYSPAECTAEFVGPSPVTCKLLQARDGDFGLSVRVPSNGPQGYWCMYLDATKGDIGPCRPLVTSITPVTEAVAQTPEEIDTIMSRAAREGTRLEVVTADGETHVGDIREGSSGDWDLRPYRMPAKSTFGDCLWLGSSTELPKHMGHLRVVSVRELPPEKQTEAEMLALLQAAERDGNHVEATMCDGSKVSGAVTDISMGRVMFSGMLRCCIGGTWASFGAHFDCERIAAVKALPSEEKHPDSLEVRIDGGSAATVTFTTGPYLLATGNSTVTPTCCADVAPYIGRRVRVTDTDGNDDIGTIALVGLYDGKEGFEIEEQPAHYWSMDGVTIELLPDEPAPSASLLIEPKVPADLEPYIGRRVRVLAGAEHEVVREGALSHVTYRELRVDDGDEWYWRAGVRSTLVEVLPELQAAEPDDCDDDLEDDADDAVSAGSIRMWEEPVLTYGTLQMQVDGKPALVVIGADGTLNAKEDGRRLVLTSEGRGESKLTLAELLALAPPPSEVRAYEAFQLTVREAMTTGIISG